MIWWAKGGVGDAVVRDRNVAPFFSSEARKEGKKGKLSIKANDAHSLAGARSLSGARYRSLLTLLPRIQPAHRPRREIPLIPVPIHRIHVPPNRHKPQRINLIHEILILGTKWESEKSRGDAQDFLDFVGERHDFRDAGSVVQIEQIGVGPCMICHAVSFVSLTPQDVAIGALVEGHLGVEPVDEKSSLDVVRLEDVEDRVGVG